MGLRSTASFLALVTSFCGVACRDQPSRAEPATDARTVIAAAPADVTPAAPADERGDAGGPPVRNDGTIFVDTEMMGTQVSINVYVGPDGDARAAGRAVEAAFEEMSRIEGLLSEWRPQSELSRLNRAAGGEPMRVSSELAEVLARSREISEETDGHFDVTFHAVGQLWSFRPGATPPSKEAIEAELPLVDWRGIEVTRTPGGPSFARLARPGMMVGLGAIGKGYAVQRASEVLKSQGFHDHVVEAGGDTHAAGTKGGQPWMVGVQNPDEPGVLGVLPSSNRSVVTSGDYQRFFDHEGKRYAHIIHPRTGWPIELESSPKSVTLVADGPTEGDAYCTAVVVMGAEAGMRFVESKPDLQAIIVTRSGELLISSGLRDAFIATTPQGKPL